MNAEATVVELEKRGSICPTQWKGRTDDHRVFYARYRWGKFTASLGATMTHAVNRKPAIVVRDPDVGGSAMNTGLMKRLCEPHISFEDERERPDVDTQVAFKGDYNE